MKISLSRRHMLQGAAALSLTLPVQATASTSGARLLTVPTRLYRSPFNARENLDGWVFFLIVETAADMSPIPVALRLLYRAAGETVREERIAGAALAAISRQDIPPARLTGTAPDPAVYWPQAMRIHSYVPHSPAIDALHVELVLRDPGGSEQQVEGHFPIIDYQQQTALIFPFRGPGVISQGGVLGGGHRNRSGGFAIDVLALDPNHAPVSRPGSDRPEDYAGWGRPIIAPAAGVIVAAVTDRPDQPKDGESNPAFFAPQYPNGGDVGNHVVIDHGHSEYSLIAHMRAGSVRVRAGQRIAQGEQIGELGNSGDTSGPHMHYQLQDGPRWEYADGLPVRFENLSSLARGSYFDAK